MGARVTNGLTPEQQKERLEIVRREAERERDRNDRFFKQANKSANRPRNAHGPNCPFDKRRRWHRVSTQLQRKPIRILALVLFARHDIDTSFRDIGNYKHVVSVK